MRRVRPLLLVFTAVIVLMVGIPIFLTWRQVRQEHLNQSLLLALKKHDDLAALRALQQGADATIHDSPSHPLPSWRLWWDLIRGRQPPSPRGSSTLLLQLAVSEGDGYPFYNPRLDLTRTLLEGGANPNEKDAAGYTALMYAVVDNRPDLIRLLIAHGADPNVTDDTGELGMLIMEHACKGNVISYMSSPAQRPGGGYTLLMCAVGYGQPESVRALLEAPVQINKQDERGHTALSVAIESYRPEYVRLLLAHHANWRQKDASGRTPLAEAKGDLTFITKIKYLRTHKVRQPSLEARPFNDLLHKDRQIIDLLQQAGAKE